MPETRIGLIPDVGGSSRLPSVVGLGRAKELIMTGKLIGGEEAERIGLANRVAPAEELDEAVQGLVDELLACAPVAVGLAKRVMDASAQPALATTLELEVADPGALRGDGRLRRGRAGVQGEAPAGVQRPLTPSLHHHSWPTSTGSGCSATPKRSSTPAAISRASAISSAVVAPPRLTSASVCLVEMPTRPSP